jgi:hypothetical protein
MTSWTPPEAMSSLAGCSTSAGTCSGNAWLAGWNSKDESSSPKPKSPDSAASSCEKSESIPWL